MSNAVRPEHYKVGGIEPYEYMRMKLTKEQYEGFLLGNVIKYVSRYQHKNGVEDLKKAQWYLNELVKLYKEDEQNEKHSDTRTSGQNL
jgi:hypothetical protein